MALRCKPGDMAVCINGAMTGLFVTVIERGVNHPLFNLPAWACRVAARCAVTHVDMATGRPLNSGHVRAGSIVMFCDCELQPIRPGKPPEATPAPPVELELSP